MTCWLRRMLKGEDRELERSERQAVMEVASIQTPFVWIQSLWSLLACDEPMAEAAWLRHVIVSGRAGSRRSHPGTGARCRWRAGLSDTTEDLDHDHAATAARARGTRIR